MRFLLFTFYFCLSYNLIAASIVGTVKDEKGNPIAFASILVKKTIIGVTANEKGEFILNLPEGSYILSCQHVGYTTEEQRIEVATTSVQVNFILKDQSYSLEEVVIKKGEDAAYKIMREAIRKRRYYQEQLTSFQCDVYLKGHLKLRSYPKRVLGQKVDFDDGDTSKKKTIFLSETIAQFGFERPNKSRIDVLSTRVSGQSDGLGFSTPAYLSFYDNNIKIGENLNPRGFISPIASNALSFYKYHYAGSFFEGGKEINRIQVTPKRIYEPLFSGYINIIEGDWRIHSLQLRLTKQSQMELVDTVVIDQIYVPLQDDIWVIKQQNIYPAVKLLGFDAYGNFLQVYSNFKVNPSFPKKHFNETVLNFNNDVNKRNLSYWDSIRPISLLNEEVKDYQKKDSLEVLRKTPAYQDSLDRKHNKPNAVGIILTGTTIEHTRAKQTFQLPALLDIINYNTVEGANINFSPTYTKRYKNLSWQQLTLQPTVRYGFNNHHLNFHLNTTYNFDHKYYSSLYISGGKRVFQFDNNNPIDPRDNTISTLLYERNYMKIYEAWFGKIQYTKDLGKGFIWREGLEYQDRIPLENTTDYNWNNYTTRHFTPNYPTTIIAQNFKRHQAFIATTSLTWKPGTKYINLPNQTISLPSTKYPIMQLEYTKGVKNWLGSDVDYSKWRFTIDYTINANLFGTLKYRVQMGGFLRKRIIEVPDYQHFLNNQTIIASPFLHSFQLAGYYQHANTYSFYTTAFAEHHFNGALTNKIPFFRTLNWHLVIGANYLFLQPNYHYVEVFGGIENILKVLRIDYVHSFETGGKQQSGIRIGIPLLFDETGTKN